MLKLYKFTDAGKHYWETWEHNGVHTVHWGELGTKGQTKELKSTFLKKAENVIQGEINKLVEQGYRQAEEEFTLMIEYAVEGVNSGDDVVKFVEKRHRLQDRMDETLGWTGLGHCDGGSIGSGTMEVCCFVVDFEIAKAVIAVDLKGTEFENYTRIYDENEDG